MLLYNKKPSTDICNDSNAILEFIKMDTTTIILDLKKEYRVNILKKKQTKSLCHSFHIAVSVQANCITEMIVLSIDAD